MKPTIPTPPGANLPSPSPDDHAHKGGCCQDGGAKGTPSTRRDFLMYVGIGLNLLAGVLFSIPVIGYVLSTFSRKKTEHWIDLGAIDTFQKGQTRLASFTNPIANKWDGYTDQIPCWVRRLEEEDKFQVFAINCTHLGCPVRWFAQSRLFMCPCHGGVFYENGAHASGPPPRGLYEYPYKIVDGKLLVNGGQLPTLSNTVDGATT